MNIRHEHPRLRYAMGASAALVSALVITGVCALLVVVAGGQSHSARAEPVTSIEQRSTEVKPPPSTTTPMFEVGGRTQSISGRTALIAPVPLHQVTAILVAPGDRVSKGQPLVKLDDDEQRAEVRAAEAALDEARIVVAEAERYLVAAEKSYRAGGFSEQRYFEIRTNALKAHTHQRAAQAALDESRAELEHYVVAAAIDGVVSALDVHLGTVSRPGTTVWGEIVDLGEIDVRCTLGPDDVELLTVGYQVELLHHHGERYAELGRVVMVGVVAERESGLVPVIVRFRNATGRLRANVPVHLRFTIANGAKPHP